MSTNPQDLLIQETGDPDAKSWPIRIGDIDLKIRLIETERGYRAIRPTSSFEYISVERTYASEVLEDVAEWLDDPWSGPRLWSVVLEEN